MTKSILTLGVAVLGLTALVAQPPRGPRGTMHGGDFTALKQTLSLTDDQVERIRGIQRAGRSPETMKAMMDKRRAIGEATKNGESAEKIAALIKDAESARAQAKAARDAARVQTLSVLTSEQKTKLQALQEAAKLMPSVRQAAAAGLLEAPEGAPGPGFAPGLRGHFGRR